MLLSTAAGAAEDKCAVVFAGIGGSCCIASALHSNKLNEGERVQCARLRAIAAPLSAAAVYTKGANTKSCKQECVVGRKRQGLIISAEAKLTEKQFSRHQQRGRTAQWKEALKGKKTQHV